MGPPDLAELGLPTEIEIRLHNQLYDRGLWTEYEARKALTEINSALLSAFRVDVHRLLHLYHGNEVADGSEKPPKILNVPRVADRRSRGSGSRSRVPSSR